MNRIPKINNLKHIEIIQNYEMRVHSNINRAVVDINIIKMNLRKFHWVLLLTLNLILLNCMLKDNLN